MTVPNLFAVSLLKFTMLREIPGARVPDDFRALLDAMEYGDTTDLSDEELREVCVMALQDREPEAAAALVLQRDLGDFLREGQIRNLSAEMQDEKLWEEYADMSLHERLFNSGSLLFAALPQFFPEPDAVRVTFEITAQNEPAKRLVDAPLSESFLIRLLADGMETNSALHRVFDEELQGKSFPDAEKIVWIVDSASVAPNKVRTEVVSSGYWLDALRDTISFESSARPDRKSPP